MQAEIITIGDELLIGMTVDTNSAWMATELTSIGFRVYQITSVSDNKEHIIKAIDQAMSRSELVLVTGGLGPTSDDITKQTIAGYFDSELVMNESVLNKITQMVGSRGIEMNENNRRQALVPEKCTVLENSRGTAPGMLFNRGGKILVSMPGVPYEMKYIMNAHVIPHIKTWFKRGAIVYRLVMTYGTFEARLAEILEDFEEELPVGISLAYLPTGGIIKLRLTARADTESAAMDMVNGQVLKLESIIPQYIYGYDGIMLEESVGRMLADRGLTISTAESCTGGNIARMITSIPGSSRYYRGSVIAYDNSVKISELGVSNDLLASNGTVSEQVAKQMAEAIRHKLDTDFGVSTTGIAGPDGGTGDKPAGTVWIGVSSKSGTTARRFQFGGERDANIRRSSLAPLNMLREQIVSL
ncbi:MAG: competence/damage-inducible protein A [Bacteroidia bacterium]|nr:MAG: competence/damage-inducible protein A [Bacteroidia bacterium]